MEIIQKVISMFPHLFIAVIVRGKECIIKYRLIKDKKIALEYKMKFDLFTPDQLSLEAINYVNSLQKKYRFAYLGFYLNTPNQGAISGNSKNEFKKLGLNYNDVSKLFINNRWTVYASHKDISFTKNYFKDVGIDFIFSPFILNEYFIRKEVKEGGMQLFMIYDKDSVAISIYYGKKFLYSNFFKTEIVSKKDENSLEIDINDEIFEFLEESIGSFYEGRYFESSFIERVVLFDNYGIDFTLVDKIENALFLPVDTKEISIENAIIDLSKMEIIT